MTTPPSEFVLSKSEHLKAAEETPSAASNLLSEVWQRGTNQITQRPVETIVAAGAGAALLALRPWRLLGRAGAAEAEGTVAAAAENVLSRPVSLGSSIERTAVSPVALGSSIEQAAVSPGALRASIEQAAVSPGAASVGRFGERVWRPNSGITREFHEILYGNSPASRAYWAEFDAAMERAAQERAANAARAAHESGSLTIQSPLSHGPVDSFTSGTQTISIASRLVENPATFRATGNSLSQNEIQLAERLAQETATNHSAGYHTLRSAIESTPESLVSVGGTVSGAGRAGLSHAADGESKLMRNLSAPLAGNAESTLARAADSTFALPVWRTETAITDGARYHAVGNALNTYHPGLTSYIGDKVVAGAEASSNYSYQTLRRITEENVDKVADQAWGALHRQGFVSGLETATAAERANFLKTAIAGLRGETIAPLEGKFMTQVLPSTDVARREAVLNAVVSQSRNFADAFVRRDMTYLNHFASVSEHTADRAWTSLAQQGFLPATHVVPAANRLSLVRDWYKAALEHASTIPEKGFR